MSLSYIKAASTLHWGGGGGGGICAEYSLKSNKLSV